MLKAIATPSYGSVIGAPKGTAGLMVMIGDSLTGNAISVSGSADYTYYQHQRGWDSWFQMKYNYPLIIKSLYRGTTPAYGSNQGVGGEYSYQVFARLQEGALSQNPDHVFWWPGTNDIKNDFTAENVFANTRLAYELCMRNGVSKFWAPAIPPRHNGGGVAFSAPQEAQRLLYNAMLATFESENSGSFIYIPLDPVMIDPATGLLYLTYAYDGLHLTSTGAYVMAKEVGKKYESLGGGILRRGISPAYSATNPYGNLLTNPTLTGTGGTVSTGGTGSLPDNWRAERSTGSVLTWVGSIVSGLNINGDTVNKMQFALTSVGSGADTDELRIRPSADVTTNVVAGWYEYEFEAELDVGTATLLRTFYVRLVDNAANGDEARLHSSRYTSGASELDVYPVYEVRKGIYRTWPVYVKDTTGIQPYIYAACDTRVVGTQALRICDPVLRPVPDPMIGKKLYQPIMTIAIHADSSGQVAYTNMPAALAFFTGTYRGQIHSADLTNYTEGRICYMQNSAAAAAGAKLIGKFNPTADSTIANWSDLGVTEISATYSAVNTYHKSSWIKLAAAARADVLVTVASSGGDGAADPTYGSICLQFR